MDGGLKIGELARKAGVTTKAIRFYERKRAIETRRYLIRAANTGISAIVAPDGEIVQATALFTPAVLVGSVSAIAGHTLYVQSGDVFAWSTVLVSAVAAVVCIAARRPKTIGTALAVERGETSAPFETGGHN